MFITISSSNAFHYGLKTPIGTDVPVYSKHLTFKEAKLSFPQYPHTEYIYGVVSYAYPLPENIVKQFNLSDLNKKEEELRWDDFVAFARDRKKKMELKQFQKDYMLSDGIHAKQNPLFRGVKPHSALTINLLAKYTKYKSTFAGLTEFWESL